MKADTISSPGEDRYYYRCSTETVGPVSKQELIDMVTCDVIPPTTLIRREDGQMWLPISGLLEKLPGYNQQSKPKTYGVVGRYSDGYLHARTLVTIGDGVKIIGGILFALFLIGGVVMASSAQSGAPLAIGFALACITGIPIAILGVLLASQGQILLATLDTAVNTSKQLSEQDTASLLRQ